MTEAGSLRHVVFLSGDHGASNSLAAIGDVAEDSVSSRVGGSDAIANDSTLKTGSGIGRTLASDNEAIPRSRHIRAARVADASVDSDGGGAATGCANTMASNSTKNAIPTEAMAFGVRYYICINSSVNTVAGNTGIDKAGNDSSPCFGYHTIGDAGRGLRQNDAVRTGPSDRNMIDQDVFLREGGADPFIKSVAGVAGRCLGGSCCRDVSVFEAHIVPIDEYGGVDRASAQVCVVIVGEFKGALIEARPDGTNGSFGHESMKTDRSC